MSIRNVVPEALAIVLFVALAAVLFTAVDGPAAGTFAEGDAPPVVGGMP